MIVSASRRTDIPAFYAEWFMNRIRNRFVLTRNPFRPAHIDRISLDPASVDAVVFWTRNAEPLIPHLDELDSLGYRYYFQYTLVHYPRVFERWPVSLSEKIDRFKRLSQRVGPDKVVWRYDPIILSSLTGPVYHRGHFAQIAGALRGFTRRAVISFLDIYRKTKRALDRLTRTRKIRIIDIHRHEEMVREICGPLAEIGRTCDLEMFTCAEPFNLEDLGIRHGKCIDDELLNRLFGLTLTIARDKGQRKLCGCVESKDIGAYDTCPHGCIYCYANLDSGLARRNFQNHKKDAPLLL
jgi:hypothetical protein